MSELPHDDQVEERRKDMRCEAVAKSQGLAPDYNDKVLYLVNEAQRPIGTIDYIRGLESHINVGTDPAISNAISLIQTEF